MSWLILLIAGIFEVVWATGLKFSEGFKKLIPPIITIATMVVSVVLLSFAMKTLPLGTAYAVWTGIGAIGTVIFGIFVFKEPATIPRLTFVAFILVGIIGLKITSGS
ncbi:hypothetical protein AZF37_05795 [endosymbiont 'TC1' of Trimyema compressum]|uniref:quaternary ammonium compound efflux SMR transporter SugE n=1 Tax=endosymbiont 'TC1' of Trimyema compressum TaxID=243899 RepID=UPI0007F15B33|nr:quaternary ammonium compound efflux SMR transporter SugE [endosymbiont 'TC1' of Trimyema compressum]AMP20752.1 hypothetical protein AZF37_05795 [endosymbiont 'TC1' of Trimyema compressum]